MSPRRAASRLGGQVVAKVFQRYYFLLMLSPQSLTAKRPNSHAFCLLYPDFPTKHVHMELCNWLKHLRVTPSGHFFYLSTRKSWLETFILDEAIVEVSPPRPYYPDRQYSLPYLLWHPIGRTTAHPISNLALLNGSSLLSLGIIWLGELLTAPHI